MSFSAARLSSLTRRSSHRSSRRHVPTVCGLMPSLAAISALVFSSRERKSRRASSRILRLALPMGLCLQEVLGEVGEAPGLAVPSNCPVGGQLHRVLDQLRLLVTDYERHHHWKGFFLLLG